MVSLPSLLSCKVAIAGNPKSTRTVAPVVDFDPADLAPREAYRFMTSAVVPRPIAWVSTVSAEGHANLAPFSYFNAFSSAPMVLGIGIGRRRGGEPKDTLRNILDTEEFVVNLVSEAVAEQMVQTSAEHAHGESEFEAAGLTPEKSARVRPPRVAESPVSLECILYETLDLGTSRARGGEQPTPNSSTLVLGEVVHVRAADDVLDDAGNVRIDRLAPVARLGGPAYWRRGEAFDMPRPPRPS